MRLTLPGANAIDGLDLELENESNKDKAASTCMAEGLPKFV